MERKWMLASGKQSLDPACGSQDRESEVPNEKLVPSVMHHMR